MTMMLRRRSARFVRRCDYSVPTGAEGLRPSGQIKLVVPTSGTRIFSGTQRRTASDVR
ncbi:MAG: hypothetical protein HY704_10330 [Gemmatimonadetes bacterium]|nr:hypothetical protein [Gemmatimonadota bacterium]